MMAPRAFAAQALANAVGTLIAITLAYFVGAAAGVFNAEAAFVLGILLFFVVVIGGLTWLVLAFLLSRQRS